MIVIVIVMLNVRMLLCLGYLLLEGSDERSDE